MGYIMKIDDNDEEYNAFMADDCADDFDNQKFDSSSED